MDLTVFSGEVTALAAGIGVVGAAFVGTSVLTRSFPFITAWVGKLYSAARGRG